MANIYDNKLEIIGSVTEIENVFNSIKGTFDDGAVKRIDFHAISPIPNNSNENWRKWKFDNWGALETFLYNKNDERDTNDTIYFRSAYSYPSTLIQKLSFKFPNLSFIICSTDMDNFQEVNIKKITFKNGEILKYILPRDGSIEAHEIYFEMYPEAREDYIFENNRYMHKEFSTQPFS